MSAGVSGRSGVRDNGRQIRFVRKTRDLLRTGQRIAGFLAFAVFLCLGCSVQEEGGEKIRDLEFEIVREKEIPEELMRVIESKKQQIFRLSYRDDGNLYIATGYGEQKSGGYSIQVRELYLAENAIYFDTELHGPQKEETVRPAKSYPYIVIKTQQRKEAVVFQ